MFRPRDGFGALQRVGAWSHRANLPALASLHGAAQARAPPVAVWSSWLDLEPCLQQCFTICQWSTQSMRKAGHPRGLLPLTAGRRGAGKEGPLRSVVRVECKAAVRLFLGHARDQSARGHVRASQAVVWFGVASRDAGLFRPVTGGCARGFSGYACSVLLQAYVLCVSLAMSLARSVGWGLW